MDISELKEKIGRIGREFLLDYAINFYSLTSNDRQSLLADDELLVDSIVRC